MNFIEKKKKERELRQGGQCREEKEVVTQRTGQTLA